MPGRIDDLAGRLGFISYIVRVRKGHCHLFAVPLLPVLILRINCHGLLIRSGHGKRQHHLPESIIAPPDIPTTCSKGIFGIIYHHIEGIRRVDIPFCHQEERIAALLAIIYRLKGIRNALCLLALSGILDPLRSQPCRILHCAVRDRPVRKLLCRYPVFIQIYGSEITVLAQIREGCQFIVCQIQIAQTRQ